MIIHWKNIIIKGSQKDINEWIDEQKRLGQIQAYELVLVNFGGGEDGWNTTTWQKQLTKFIFKRIKELKETKVKSE